MEEGMGAQSRPAGTASLVRSAPHRGVNISRLHGGVDSLNSTGEGCGDACVSTGVWIHLTPRERGVFVKHTLASPRG